MNNRSQGFWSVVVIGSFFLGLLSGLVLAGKIASAAQKFGPENVASVPDTFLKGGDRSYTVLREIQSEVTKHSQLLEQIADTTDSLNRTVKATVNVTKNSKRTFNSLPRADD